jgi:DNA-binding MarR family transcriptional regulator
MQGTRRRAIAGRIAKRDYERLAHFRYQLRRFLRFSEDVTRRHGMTPLQYLLLLQIRGFPGREWANVGELAERLQAKQHGVVSLISRCEVAGLVRRSISRSDRRRVEVTLTRKGDERLERLARLHRDELRALHDEPVPGWPLPDIRPRDPPRRKSATRTSRERSPQRKHGD